MGYFRRSRSSKRSRFVLNGLYQLANQRKRRFTESLNLITHNLNEPLIISGAFFWPQISQIKKIFCLPLITLISTNFFFCSFLKLNIACGFNHGDTIDDYAIANVCRDWNHQLCFEPFAKNPKLKNLIFRHSEVSNTETKYMVTSNHNVSPWLKPRAMFYAFSGNPK